MKKLLLILLLSIVSVSIVDAQQQQQKTQQIVVNTSDLTPDQLAKVQARNEIAKVTDKLETYSKYAGMGKEVGIAVSEGLGAVKDVTLEFADSNVGKLTMALIVWKVIGDDIKGFVFGIPLWLLLSSALIWSYRRTCLRTKKLIKREGGWWIFGGIKQYETKQAMYYDGGGAAVHALLLFAMTALMFGTVIF